VSVALRLLAGLLLSVSPVLQALELRVVGSDGEPMPGATVREVSGRFSPPELPGTAVVDQRDRRFAPHVTVVAPGAAVTFPNSDDTRHHVYSFSEGNAFELKLYRANEAPPVDFETPGVVTLGCNIHDNMKAYIVVAEEPGVALADEQGRASLPWLPPDAALVLDVWHPQLEAPQRFEVASPAAGGGALTLTLPVSWSDPQAVKSISELESLLKRYSRDAN
jgi:plastocyanin